jgi:hypothetical protein
MRKFLPCVFHVLCFVMAVMLSPLALHAKFLPPHTVTGQILDSKKSPLANVTVLLKGTQRGVHHKLGRTFYVHRSAR